MTTTPKARKKKPTLAQEIRQIENEIKKLDKEIAKLTKELGTPSSDKPKKQKQVQKFGASLPTAIIPTQKVGSPD